MTNRTPASPIGLRLLAGAGLCGLLAACGSSPPPTRAAYAQAAGAICTSYNAKLKAVGSQLAAARSQADIDDDLQQAITLSRQGDGRLDALRKPSGDTTAIDAALASLRTQAGALEALLQAEQADDRSALPSASAQFQSANSAVTADFDAAGIPACSPDSSP